MPKLSLYAIIANRRQSCKNTGSHNLKPRATFRKAEWLLQGVFIVNQVRIIPLDTVLHVDKTAIGPKALSLVRLSRLGLAIPAGFCITAAMF